MQGEVVKYFADVEGEGDAIKERWVVVHAGQAEPDCF
jgi:hypothetical protein